MNFNLQSTLTSNLAVLRPLREDDFDALYQVASDPKIWEQHPNKDRWKKEVFSIFFQGAIKSNGAFKIIDKTSGEIIGCTRFYEHDADNDQIFIGYTFYARAYWGKGYNIAVKTIMLDYIFQFVKQVNFHIGAENLRSQIAISRLGAAKIAEQEIAYFGEPTRLNFLYQIEKSDWEGKKV